MSELQFPSGRDCPDCGNEMESLLTGTCPPGDYQRFYACPECNTQVYP